MNKLPQPETPYGFSKCQLRLAYEEGRKAMLDEVLRLAPNSMLILLKAFDDQTKADSENQSNELVS